MDREDTWKRTGEREIDLIDLLRRLCRQWKRALVCAALFTAIFGGYSYLRGSHSAAILDDNMANSVLLTEEERQSVDEAVQLKGRTAALEEYLEASRFMQINPYREGRAVLLYSIDQAEEEFLQKIMGSYLSFVADGGVVDVLAGLDSWDVGREYLAELITIKQGITGISGLEDMGDLLPDRIFRVQVVEEDEETAKALALDIQDALEGYYHTVEKTAGSHELSLISSEVGIWVDSGLHELQSEVRERLASDLESLKTKTNAFSEGQQLVYQDNIFEENEQEITAEDHRDSVSKKYLLFGFVAGVVVYCAVFCCLYIFSDRIKSTKELKYVYHLPFFGSISCFEAGGDAAGKQEEKLLNRIRIVCKKQGITRFCLVSVSCLDRQEKGWIDSIARQLKEWGIDIFVVENVSGDTAMWDTLTEIGNVLLVCRIGVTTHQMIDEEMQFYLDNGIDVVGIMAFVLKDYD